MSTQNRMIITEAIEEEDKNSTSSDDGASVRPVLGAMEENQTTQARRIGTVGQRTSDRDPVDLELITEAVVRRRLERLYA